TILLVHGWNGRAAQLAPFVDPLVASGFRVVAFDHVGHGDSTGSSTTIAQMAEAIAAVSRASGGTEGLVAHSLGAGASVLAMHDGLPIRRAVLIAPPLTPDPWFAHFGRMLGLDERASAYARAEVERRVGRRFDELHVPTLASVLRQPALIIHDRDDREVPIGAGEALSYAWRGSRFLVTAGLGHKRILKAPGVLESVRRFLLAQTD
ncbi:MAG TPA: alpha/beta fold hydrolase, partial [Sandaracinaceae bacterium]